MSMKGFLSVKNKFVLITRTSRGRLMIYQGREFTSGVKQERFSCLQEVCVYSMLAGSIYSCIRIRGP